MAAVATSCCCEPCVVSTTLTWPLGGLNQRQACRQTCKAQSWQVMFGTSSESELATKYTGRLWQMAWTCCAALCVWKGFNCYLVLILCSSTHHHTTTRAAQQDTHIQDSQTDNTALTRGADQIDSLERIQDDACRRSFGAACSASWTWQCCAINSSCSSVSLVVTTATGA